MSKCFIITSFVEGYVSIGELISNDDYIICADNGFKICSINNITPNLIIGDLDSLSFDIPTEIEAIKLPKEKDDTDTLAAVKYAINLGYNYIVIIGGMGGRLDHTMANLQSLLYGAKHNVMIEMRDAYNIASIHKPSQFNVLSQSEFFISLFSFSELCKGVTISGVKYPLNDYTLLNSFPIGVSNEFTANHATISFDEGFLLVILSKDRY